MLRQKFKTWWILFCTDSRGQSSVEAAVTLPIFMILLALLIQPVIMLYTRTQMQAAAAESCRLMTTYTSTGSGPHAKDRYEEYTIHRLSGVPDLDIFHVGGDDGWVIILEGGQGVKNAHVSISTLVRPLPVVGISAGLFGRHVGNDVLMEVSIDAQVRPEWVSGDYKDWSQTFQ